MGLFDIGLITCPHCGEITEEQTKSFDCMLEYFDLDETIEAHIAHIFTGKWRCDHCEKEFYVHTAELPNKIKLKVSKKPLEADDD